MAVKKSTVKFTENVLYMLTGTYYRESEVEEFSVAECQRLIGQGVAVSIDGTVIAPKPKPPALPSREPIGKPRSFKKSKREVKDGKSGTN